VRPQRLRVVVGSELACKCGDFPRRGVQGGVHQIDTPDTLEQVRAVDLAVVHEDVRVEVGRDGDVSLADAGTDLGPALTR
jgi:hypothetical protein